MNIQFQMAGILLLLVVALLMMRQKTIGIYTGSAFLRLFVAVTFCVFLNLFSTAVYYHKPDDIFRWEDILYRAYLLSVPLVGSIFSIYTHMEIHKKDRHVMKFALVVLIPCFLEVMVLAFVPLIYLEKENQTYIMGMGVNVAHFLFFAYMIFSAVYVFCYRKIMEKAAQHILLCLVGVGVSTIIIQTFFQRNMFLSFVMCVAIVYLYMTLENPQIYIDRKTMVYNAYAYNCYLDKQLDSGNKFYLTTVQINDWHFVHENLGMKCSRNVLMEVACFLSSLSEGKVKVFRVREEVFGLVFESELDMVQSISAISSRFIQPWEVHGTKIMLEEVMVSLADIKLLNYGDEMADVIHFFLVDAGKQGGGTHICIDEVQLLKRTKMIEAEKSLKWALDNNRVEVYYHPIFNIHTGQFTSMEALARIWDESKQLVMPNVFIPIAEQTGLILELGLQLFEKVCIFLREEEKNGLAIETVDINLSMVQCMQTSVILYHFPSILLNWTEAWYGLILPMKKPPLLREVLYL